jgi:hypothetical protein
MLIHGNANLIMQDGLSSINTILTYQLEEWQLNCLCESIKVKQIKDRALKVFIADDFIDIYATPYFLAFLNFRSASEVDMQGFFEYWRECLQPLSPELARELEKEIDLADLKMSPTYVFNCQGLNVEKKPYLFVDSDIFSNHDKLRLALLQEIKNVEGEGHKACENSIRLRRVLKIYQWLAYRKEATVKELHGVDEPVSLRMLQHDLAIIRGVDHNVRYDPARKKYVFDRTSGDIEVDFIQGHKEVSRLERILLIYRQLIYQGWITKEAVDEMGKPVSLRMFQRDMRIIREEIDSAVKYDKAGKRFIMQGGRFKDWTRE